MAELEEVICTQRPDIPTDVVGRVVAHALRVGDANGDGKLDFEEFAAIHNELMDLLVPHGLVSGPAAVVAPGAATARASILDDGAVADAPAAEQQTWPHPCTTTLEEAHRQLQSSIHATFLQLADAFAALDPDASGRVANDKFAQVLRAGAIPLDEADLQTLIESYDADGDGSILYSEFCTAMGAEASGPAPTGASNMSARDGVEPDLEARVAKVEEVLRAKIHERYETVTSAFRSIDDNQSGYLDAFEFVRLLAQHNIRVSDAEMEVLLARFDTNYDGKMDLKEFFAFLQPRHHELWRLSEGIADQACR